MPDTPDNVIPLRPAVKKADKTSLTTRLITSVTKAVKGVFAELSSEERGAIQAVDEESDDQSDDSDGESGFTESAWETLSVSQDDIPRLHEADPEHDTLPSYEEQVIAQERRMSNLIAEEEGAQPNATL